MVYEGNADGNVYALNTANGAELFRFRTGAFVDSSPAVVGGMLYVGSGDGKVYAFGL
jgi:outer membrane protein assembly factor BamB